MDTRVIYLGSFEIHPKSPGCFVVFRAAQSAWPERIGVASTEGGAREIVADLRAQARRRK
jgi:hypothetical protein